MVPARECPFPIGFQPLVASLPSHGPLPLQAENNRGKRLKSSEGLEFSLKDFSKGFEA